MVFNTLCFATLRLKTVAHPPAPPPQWKEQMRNRAQDSMETSQWVQKHGSPFAALDLPETATKDEVRAAYRKLSMKMHPDKGGSMEDFQRIQFAQSIILKDWYSAGDVNRSGPAGTRVELNPRLKAMLYGALFTITLTAGYLLIYLPLRWIGRKTGLLQQPAAVVSSPEMTLKEEVKRLQSEVNQLQVCLII